MSVVVAGAGVDEVTKVGTVCLQGTDFMRLTDANGGSAGSQQALWWVARGSSSTAPTSVNLVFPVPLIAHDDERGGPWTGSNHQHNIPSFKTSAHLEIGIPSWHLHIFRPGLKI